MTAQTEIIQGKGFDAEVIRTNRKKTASVRVQEGKVSVVVPKSTSQARVEELVLQKTRWIREKLLLHQEYPLPKPKEYISGECFTYLGRNYRLKIEQGSTRSVKLINGRLLVTLPRDSVTPENVKEKLTAWYRTHAEQKLQDKVERYAKVVRVKPSSVAVKAFKSRWGSCSTKGELLFNWKIIIAPNRIVDYVVVHELCHLHHHNHSPEFWQCVERVFADYQECRNWLRVNGRWLEV